MGDSDGTMHLNISLVESLALCDGTSWYAFLLLESEFEGIGSCLLIWLFIGQCQPAQHMISHFFAHLEPRETDEFLKEFGSAWLSIIHSLRF